MLSRESLRTLLTRLEITEWSEPEFAVYRFDIPHRGVVELRLTRMLNHQYLIGVLERDGQPIRTLMRDTSRLDESTVSTLIRSLIA